MGYKWLPVTEDFDKTLVIKKWRFNANIPISDNYDGALSELPNIDIKNYWNNPQPSNVYAFSKRFNLCKSTSPVDITVGLTIFGLL